MANLDGFDGAAMPEKEQTVNATRCALSGPHCWSGETVSNQRWFRALKEHEIDAIESMLASVRMRVGDDSNSLLGMTAADFSLGTFSTVVEEIEAELRDGRGFCVIRTLPVQRWSALETMIVYWGIACHLGTPLPNNHLGDMIGHVTDLGGDYTQATNRGYDSNAKLSYHCDQCDVVGLLCRYSARSGGISKLVSTAAVYNEILRRRPDLLEVLCQPLYFSRMGEEEPGQTPWYTAPVFDFVDGAFHCAAGINHIVKGHALPGAPAMTALQTEALELFETVSEELEFSMHFEPGDIQFLNNGLVAHTRSAFTDWPDAQRRRHLLRVWLRVPTTHQGAAYFENWRNGVTPRHDLRLIRESPHRNS